MKYIIVFLTALLLALPGFTQQRPITRSDTIGISIPFRYLVLSAGAGIEVPVRNHAYAALINRNYLPFPREFREVSSLALEYRRYFQSINPHAHDYLGAYLLFMDNDFALPSVDEENPDSYWVQSRSANIGFLSGWKLYARRWFYLDLFSGVHVGYETGTRRWDVLDPNTNKIQSFTEEAERVNFGFRLGLNIGIQF